MQEKHLYEYAIIRFLPKVEREEFINVGIIMFSKRMKYIKSKYALNEDKLRLFSTEADIGVLKSNLEVFNKICVGEESSDSPIARFEVPERFRWLTAVRSSSLQTSRPHPGFSTDLDATLERLFSELVL